ncbi:MAG: AAA family ATPase, partial [Bacteroidetes bacterium]|nr:AAA family ATPase [Bacteroidota bacterium]
MNPLPIGIQDFHKIRESGLLYIAKTEQLFRLISAGSYYFLS